MMEVDKVEKVSTYGNIELTQFLIDVSILDELFFQILVGFCTFPVTENHILAVMGKNSFNFSNILDFHFALVALAAKLFQSGWIEFLFDKLIILQNILNILEILSVVAIPVDVHPDEKIIE